MADTVILKQKTAEEFKNAMRYGRIILFSAPCGMGKTTTANALLNGLKVCRMEPDERFALPDPDGDWEVLLVDGLQYVQEKEDQQALCDLIQSRPERRFVLLSRGFPPGWLISFQFAGQMSVLDTKALLFDQETTARFFRERGISPSDAELSAIQTDTYGYPLALGILARHMQDGTPYSAEMNAQLRRELYVHYETAVYRRFEVPMRQILLDLAPFETFDIELARMASGNSRAEELIDWLQRNTTMLQYNSVNRFHFWFIFRDFLLWEMEREYSAERRSALFRRGGLYYELHEDYSHALECYARGEDHSKISDLLVRSAEMPASMGHYSELEKYYKLLPEQEILTSPALMQAMSMLCALRTDYEESERWYHELESFAVHCERKDALRKQARSRLAWLDISLPQRGVGGLAEKIPPLFQLLTNREVALPPFSVTSALPSIMNGGKDFSEWSGRDDLLYQTIRVPVTAILGRDGVGLPDCAVAESKFEKGEQISGRMLTLMSSLSEVQKRGMPDIEFAIIGLLARNQLDSGQPEEAKRSLRLLRSRFEENGQRRFLPNIDAMLCRLALHTGDLGTSDNWYREKAPRNPQQIDTLKRYQYLTQAMVELAIGKNDAALLTLAPLISYCKTCKRYLDGLSIHVISAIALYRKKDDSWRGALCAALDTAAEFSFVRPISVYGAAVLPLLNQCGWSGDAGFLRTLATAARTQAAYYPNYLQPRVSPTDTLTATETQVLRLICADKSNAEIGELLDIKLATVKTHVSHVLQKLGVNRRSEAKTAAQRLWLLE